MKHFILSLFLLISNSYALDISGAESGEVKSTQSSQYDQAGMDNLSILVSSQKIRFMKNPCFEQKGLHFRSFRGFAYENGIVKKFKDNGTISYDDNNGKKFDNLYSFLVNRKVCSAATHNAAGMKIDFGSLQIWN
jgi:hypothetical protein